MTSTSKIGRRSLKNFSPLLLLLVLARSCAPARLALASRESNKRRAALRGTPRVEAWWARERADCLCRRRGKKKSEKKNSPFLFFVCALFFFQLLLFFFTSGLFPPRPSRLSTIHCKFEFDFDFDAHRRVELLFQCSLFVHRGGGRRRETEASFCCRRVSSILFASRPCCSPPSLSRLRRARETTEFLFICSKGTKTCFLRVFRERNFNDTEARCLLVENKTKTITQ